MRDAIRYSEAFKLRLAEDAASGKYRSLNEASRQPPTVNCQQKPLTSYTYSTSST